MKGSREFKGNSLLEDVSDYVAIDLETIGLDPMYDDIIEFGAVKVSNGIIIDKFQSLINPGYEISPFIATLTGISNEMLASAPSLVPTLSKFIEFLGNYTIVGHNVNFDINFIYDACVNNLGVAFSNNFIDTMRLSRRIFPEENIIDYQTYLNGFRLEKTWNIELCLMLSKLMSATKALKNFLQKTIYRFLLFTHIQLTSIHLFVQKILFLQ